MRPIRTFGNLDAFKTLALIQSGCARVAQVTVQRNGTAAPASGLSFCFCYQPFSYPLSTEFLTYCNIRYVRYSIPTNEKSSGHLSEYKKLSQRWYLLTMHHWITLTAIVSRLQSVLLPISCDIFYQWYRTQGGENHISTFHQFLGWQCWNIHLFTIWNISCHIEQLKLKKKKASTYSLLLSVRWRLPSSGDCWPQDQMKPRHLSTQRKKDSTFGIRCSKKKSPGNRPLFSMRLIISK